MRRPSPAGEVRAMTIGLRLILNYTINFERGDPRACATLHRLRAQPPTTPTAPQVLKQTETRLEMDYQCRGGSMATRLKRTSHPAWVWLRPIGVIRSVLRERGEAPRQGSEGAPDAWLELEPSVSAGLLGLAAGDRLLIITWLHRGRRDVLQVHPRNDRRRPLSGVFATRSPDRPNPLGLHAVTLRRIAGRRLRIGPIEAIDGTPVVDIKPVLRARER
jgi:tRNA-Thr(GGU) m(6)t(6)A37 methyltransferase TsaA